MAKLISVITIKAVGLFNPGERCGITEAEFKADGGEHYRLANPPAEPKPKPVKEAPKAKAKPKVKLADDGAGSEGAPKPSNRRVKPSGVR